jgi:CyaY protein
MTDREYLARVEKLFRKVEDLLIDFEDTLDYDRTPDKLEITHEPSGRKIVLNTQRAIHEVWLAGNARGWHFGFQEKSGRWFAQAEQEEFADCFSRLLGDHLGESVELDLS